MIKKLRLLILATGISILLVVPVVSTTVFAGIDQASKDAACQGLGSSGCSSSADGTVESIIETVVNILSFVVGVAAVIMVIIGGFKYITSGGDSNSISSAKNTIQYAIIGLVLVALAQGIVQFVFRRATT